MDARVYSDNTKIAHTTLYIIKISVILNVYLLVYTNLY